MNTPSSRRFTGRAIAASLLFLSSLSLGASVLVRPNLHTTFDPIGSREITVTAAHATPRSEIQALPELGVVRDFPGFTVGENVISLDDPQRSDARITFTGRGDAGSGDELTNASFVTSGASGVRIASNNMRAAHVITCVIDFGYWNGTAFIADVNPVPAAGFTLAAPAGRLERLASVAVEFVSPSGRVLSTQKIPGPVEDVVGIFFGHHAGPHEPIARIRILVSVAPASAGAPSQPVLLGLDDLGWTPTAVPQP